jgi:nucleoside 2-deoxyribosyltransferase/predicted secreted protein
MYVLVCPCILNPALRVEGITKPSDLRMFERATERCTQFGIEVVPLPCPEMLYLGADRKPGTFLERLNTRDFACMLDVLESRVRDVVASRGPPLCIIGVNSSPTCGVTTTYYGSTGDEPPKREGRGVFLARFPNIRAVDVSEFCRYRIYLAAPLFSEAERSYNSTLAALLRQHLFEVYVPQESGDNNAHRDLTGHARIYEQNKRALHDADMVVAVIEGADADSGTAWEMGYASGLKKPVFALRTDFRKVGNHEHVNLMLEQSATVVTSVDDLIRLLKPPVSFDKKGDLT